MTAKTPLGNDGDRGENDAPATSGYAAVGLQFAVSLVVFVLLGDWADKKLDTSPLFLLLGVFGGGSAAFYSMYRKLMGPHSKKPEKR